MVTSFFISNSFPNVDTPINEQSDCHRSRRVFI